MTRDMIWKTLKKNIDDVLSSTLEFSQKNSLRDLGANSVDRAEIIMLTLAQLKFKIPMVEFASAQNIEELIDVFHTYQQLQTQSQGK